MGVDFVPAYRRGGSDGDQGDLHPVPSDSAPAISPAAKPPAKSDPTPVMQPELKPDSASVKNRAAPKAGVFAGSSPSETAAASSPASAMSPGKGLGIAPAKPADRDTAKKLLATLQAKYEKDAPHKHFVTAFTNVVFGEGDSRARLLFIGEAPGEEEDRTGRPFVGRSGDLLGKQIAAMGLSREQVYICNVLKTRPPNNATPTSKEAELCWPYLQEQIAIVSPEVIVTLGLPAAKIILRSDQSMTRMRGKWWEFDLFDGRKIPVMPTYHPAYLLRNYTPEARAMVWSDLQQVMARLGLAAPKAAAGNAGA